MTERQDIAAHERRLLRAIRRDVLRGAGLGVAAMGAAGLPAGAIAAPAGTSALRTWSAYLDALRPAGDLAANPWFPHDDQTRAEIYRQLVMVLSQGYFWYFQATPEHPDWMPFLNSVFLLQPNPDGIYHLAPVDGRGVYRVVGYRGSNPVLNFATGSGMLGTKSHADSIARGRPGFNNYDGDGFTLGKNGAFDVIFSAERPKDWSGDWRYLHPDAESIMARQFGYDWGVEHEARFAIERLDTPPLKPQLTAGQIAARLDLLLGDFVGRFTSYVTGYQQMVFDKLGANTMELSGFEDMGNSNDWPQKYWRAYYDLAPGEALLIETEVPRAKYWNVQINDRLWNQVEFAYRQSSLNGHQARIDADGKFRALVCAADPGIANWLDTAGNSRGMLVGRWHGADAYPRPTVRKIALGDALRLLPAATPRVSAKERERVLRARNVGVQLRRRW